MLAKGVELPAHLFQRLEELFSDSTHLLHVPVLFTLVVLALVVLPLFVITIAALTLFVLTLAVLTLFVLALVVLTLFVLTLVVLTLFVLTLVVLTLFVLTLVVLMFVMTMRVLLTLANPTLLTLTFTTSALFVLSLAHPMLFTLTLKVPVLLVLALSHDVLFMFADTMTTLIVAMLVVVTLLVIVLFVIARFAALVSPSHSPERSALVADHLEQLALATLTLRGVEFARGELLDHDDHPLMPLGCIRLCHAALERSTVGSIFALRGNNGQRQAGGDEESGHIRDHDSVGGSWLVVSAAVAARRFALLRTEPTDQHSRAFPSTDVLPVANAASRRKRR